MKLLVIDNYDSFTYNLVHFLGELGAEPVVHRNDKITLDEIAALAPEAIVLSPGPCTPNEAGICLTLIDRFAPTTPILGVCLGHQAIGQAMGGDVIRAPQLMHGKTSRINHTGTRHVPRPQLRLRGDALPLADRQAGNPARGARSHRHDRRRPDHGRPAPDACRCTACSSTPRASPPRTATRCCRISSTSPATSTSSGPPDGHQGRPQQDRRAPGPDRRGNARRHDHHHVGRSDARARSAPSSWACGSRARRSARSPRRSRSCARRWCRSRRPSTPSTSSAPAATAPTRSTSRPPRPSSSPPPACRSPSTATARFPANPAPPTCCRRWGSRSTSRPSRSAAASREAGIGFMFAPAHHPAMKHVGPTRAELGIRTMFNLLGPQSNPAGARRYMLGVYAREWVEPVAAALLANRAVSAWVVHGHDGLDELSTTGPSLRGADQGRQPHELRGHARGRRPAARDARRPQGRRSAAQCRRACANCSTARASPYRDIVLLNAAAGVHRRRPGRHAEARRPACGAPRSTAAGPRRRSQKLVDTCATPEP